MEPLWSLDKWVIHCSLSWVIPRHTVLLPEILTTHCVFSYTAESRPQQQQQHIYSRVRSFKGTDDPKMKSFLVHWTFLKLHSRRVLQHSPEQLKQTGSCFRKSWNWFEKMSFIKIDWNLHCGCTSSITHYVNMVSLNQFGISRLLETWIGLVELYGGCFYVLKQVLIYLSCLGELCFALKLRQCCGIQNTLHLP